MEAHSQAAQALVPAAVASPALPGEQPPEAVAAPPGGRDGAAGARATSSAGRSGRRRNPPRQVAAAAQATQAAQASPPVSEPSYCEPPPAEGDAGYALALVLVPAAPPEAEASAAPPQAVPEAAASPLPQPDAAPGLYAGARQGSEPTEPHARAGTGSQAERAGSPAAVGDERAAAAAAAAPEPEACEELSELEDDEVGTYLHQPEEVELRKVIWEELNREYTEQQEAKQRAADAAAAKARAHWRVLPPAFDKSCA